MNIIDKENAQIIIGKPVAVAEYVESEEYITQINEINNSVDYINSDINNCVVAFDFNEYVNNVNDKIVELNDLLDNIPTEKVVINAQGMNLSSSTITELPPNFDFSTCTNVDNLFYDCEYLRTIPLLDFSNVESADYMLEGCIALRKMDGFKNMKANFEIHITEILDKHSLEKIGENLYNFTENGVTPNENQGNLIINLDYDIWNSAETEDIELLASLQVYCQYKGWKCEEIN